MNKQMIEQLNNIASVCEQAIYANETALNDPEKGYPYAAGYSRSALQDVLQKVKSMLKENTNVG